jgi:hypothetical protein
VSNSKSKQFESDLSKFAGEIHESRRSQDEGEEKYLKHKIEFLDFS